MSPPLMKTLRPWSDQPPLTLFATTPGTADACAVPLFGVGSGRRLGDRVGKDVRVTRHGLSVGRQDESTHGAEVTCESDGEHPETVRAQEQHLAGAHATELFASQGLCPNQRVTIGSKRGGPEGPRQEVGQHAFTAGGLQQIGKRREDLARLRMWRQVHRECSMAELLFREASIASACPSESRGKGRGVLLPNRRELWRHYGANERRKVSKKPSRRQRMIGREIAVEMRLQVHRTRSHSATKRSSSPGVPPIKRSCWLSRSAFSIPTSCM